MRPDAAPLVAVSQDIMRTTGRLIVLLGLCNLGVWWLAGCTRQPPVAPVKETMRKEVRKVAEREFDELTRIAMQGGDISGSDSAGRMLWSAGAKHVQMQPQGQKRVLVMTNGHAVIYRAGVPETTFQAGTMKLLQDPAGIVFQLTGNVRVTAQHVTSVTANHVGTVTASSHKPSTKPTGIPLVVQAPRMTVWVKTRLMQAEGGVTAQQGALLVQCQRLKADAGLRLATLEGGLSARSGPTSVQSSSGQMQWSARRVHLQDQVQLHNSKLSLSGQSADADWAAATGSVRGNVRLTSGDTTATAARATLDWQRHTVALLGGVVLHQGTARVAAGMVQADTGLEQVVATGSVSMQQNNATIQAARVLMYPHQHRAQASGGVTLHRGNLRVTAGRVAATGLQDRAATRIEAEGDVHATLPQGSVTARQATWTAAGLVARGEVRWSRQGYQLRGSTATSNADFSRVEMAGPVKGSLPGGGSIVAGAVSYARNQVTATGNVRIVRAGLTMAARQLEAQPDASEVTLRGDVRVRSNTGTTLRAPVVHYNATRARVVATGGVVVEDKVRGLRQRGDTLTADLHLRRVVITNVHGTASGSILEGKRLF